MGGVPGLRRIPEKARRRDTAAGRTPTRVAGGIARKGTAGVSPWVTLTHGLTPAVLGHWSGISLERPALAIVEVQVLVRLAVIGELQVRPVPLQLFAGHAHGHVTEQDRLGEYAGELEVGIGRGSALHGLHPLGLHLRVPAIAPPAAR